MAGRKALYLKYPEVYQDSPLLKIRLDLADDVTTFASNLGVTKVTVNNVQHGDNDKITVRFAGKIYDYLIRKGKPINTDRDTFVKTLQESYDTWRKDKIIPLQEKEAKGIEIAPTVKIEVEDIIPKTLEPEETEIEIEVPVV